MKRVREYVDQQRSAFSRNKLFSFLGDTSIEPKRRLTFIPFLAHFVMTFADLYNFVLPEHPPSDRYQNLVNAHLSEDATHWKWYLADLANADLDPTMRFTDALRFVWSGATRKTRMLSYGICRLSAGMTTREKLVMVNCIEAAGGVALDAAALAGNALEPSLGRKLVYFGSHHVDTEGAHTLEKPTVRESLDEVVLTEAERAALRSIVDQAFNYFVDSIDEVFALAQSGRGFADYVEKRS